MNKQRMTELTLPEAYRRARHSLTSLPWPGEQEDFPSVVGAEHQVVRLFDPPEKARLKRFLVLTAGEALTPALEIGASSTMPAAREKFSNVTIRTVREQLDRHVNPYVYRECEARIGVAGREIGLR